MRDSRETMRQVRRWEIGLGAVIVVAGVTLTSGVWRWVIVGCGLLSLLPVSGAAAILRRAERDPTVLEWDPERRRAKARRVLPALVALYVVIGAVVGYLIDGLFLAALLAVLLGGGGVIGAAWAKRQDRAT